MKPAPFRYERPSTVAEAAAVLLGDPDAKVVAGGQSLVPMMNFRLARPSTLVDIAGIDELHKIDVAAGKLCIGARITQSEAELSTLVRENFALLPACLAKVGHRQIRNRGTVCGSIAHGDPSSELPAAAVVSDAEIIAWGPDGQRVIGAADFFHAPLWTALNYDEILTEVRFPIDHPETRVSVCEYARRSGDFAIAGVTVRATLTSDGLTSAAIAAFGVGGVPVRLSATEAVVAAGGDQRALVEALVADVPEPTNDGQADGEYRLELLTALLFEALDECQEAK